MLGRPHEQPVEQCRLWTIPEGPAVDADAIVVGAGLAGLVATAELADAGRLLDIELLDHVVVGAEGWVSLRSLGATAGTG